MAEAAQERKLPVDDKIHTWPHLVRMEFLVMLFVMIGLTIWSLTIDAPLEEAANPTKTPNPSKAPWYFLGLQEMLVYFDPWHAGVVLPTLIIVGLMVIPFIDTNPRGNGYYCFKDRKWEILTFIFGFHVLWVVMIIIGTFFRGPGWNLFWPWQHWDAHKVVALTNVDLPYLLGIRDYWFAAVFGLVAIGAYFVIGMLLFYLFVIKVKGKEFLERWGMVRFTITGVILVLMMSLPAKMFCASRLTSNTFWLRRGLISRYVLRGENSAGFGACGYRIRFVCRHHEKFFHGGRNSFDAHRSRSVFIGPRAGAQGSVRESGWRNEESTQKKRRSLTAARSSSVRAYWRRCLSGLT